MREQVKRLVVHLNGGGTITSLHAWKILGISYLPQAVRKAKDLGFKFEDEFISVPNRFGEDCRIKQWWFKEPQEINENE